MKPSKVTIQISYTIFKGDPSLQTLAVPSFVYTYRSLISHDVMCTHCSVSCFIFLLDVSQRVYSIISFKPHCVHDSRGSHGIKCDHKKTHKKRIKKKRNSKSKVKLPTVILPTSSTGEKTVCAVLFYLLGLIHA